MLITLLVLLVTTGDVKAATGTTFVLHFILIMCHLAFESLWEKEVIDESG